MQERARAYVSLVLQPSGMSPSRTPRGISFHIFFARIFRIIVLPHISPANLAPVRVRAFAGLPLRVCTCHLRMKQGGDCAHSQMSHRAVGKYTFIHQEFSPLRSTKTLASQGKKTVRAMACVAKSSKKWVTSRPPPFSSAFYGTIATASISIIASLLNSAWTPTSVLAGGCAAVTYRPRTSRRVLSLLSFSPTT
jgi:hypothetical protein